MARTLGCADVGYDCVYRVVAEEGEDEFILDTTVTHAKKHHPELTMDELALKKQLRDKIRDLLDQSGYEAQLADHS